MTIDQYKPRYLIRKQLLEEQRRQHITDARENEGLAILATFVFGIPLLIGLLSVINIAGDLLESSHQEIARQVDSYNNSTVLKRGKATVTIIYTHEAEIHHVWKKLNECGYTVNTTKSKGAYRHADIIYNVDGESFRNEFDLYDYLNLQGE